MLESRRAVAVAQKGDAEGGMGLAIELVAGSGEDGVEPLQSVIVPAGSDGSALLLEQAGRFLDAAQPQHRLARAESGVDTHRPLPGVEGRLDHR